MSSPGSSSTTAPASPAPAVSIVIPAYNVAQYIAECLDSVLAQTFQDYEIIVVNDGSPDTEALEKALEAYRSRIVYIKQPNRGCPGARNTGIRAARADLVALLDPDDIWEPEYLAEQVRRLRSDPSIDVLYCDATLFGDSHLAGRRFMDLHPSTGEVTLAKLLTKECDVVVSVTARKQIFIRAGMFDESLRMSDDFDMWLRIAYHGGRFAYHRTPLLRYRRRDNAMTSNMLRMFEYSLRIYAKMANLPLSAEDRAALDTAVAKLKARKSLLLGKQALIAGRVSEAQDLLAAANGVFKNKKISSFLLVLKFMPAIAVPAARWAYRNHILWAPGAVAA